MNIASRIAAGIKGAIKALGGSARRIAVGARYALSQGTAGAWASDHREEAGHFTGWNYVAIRAIAIQAAQSEVAVYADGGDPFAKAVRRFTRKSLWGQGQRWKSMLNADQTGEPLPPDHPLCKLLNRPNPTQSRASFEYERVVQLQTTGTCLVWNVKNKLGKTVERYVIPTAMAFPEQPSREYPMGGWRIDGGLSRWQVYSADQDGFTEMGVYSRIAGHVIPADDMQVTRWPHPIWKDDGYGAVAAGATFIDTAGQIDTARFADLHNGADPSIIVTPPDDMSVTDEDLEAAQEKFNAKYASAKNRGKAMFVTAGKVEKLTTSAKDMDYVAAFTQYRDAILALHGTPGIAAGIVDGGSYAALFASLKGWTILTVQPIFDLLADSDTLTFAKEFGPGLTVEMSAAAIDDPDVLERQLQTDINAGAITKGEIRKLRGRPLFGDERDDQTAGTPDGGSPSTMAAARLGAASVSPDAGADNQRDQQPGDEQTTGVAGPIAQVLQDALPKRVTVQPVNRIKAYLDKGHAHAPETVLSKAIEGALSAIEDDEDLKAVLRSLKTHV